MLEVRITHDLPGFALDAEFVVPGGVTALFGHSGAGKSTIVNAVSGLLRPRGGRVALQGEVLFDADAGIFVPPHRRRIGYVFQDSRLFPHLTVRGNLLYGQRFAPRGATGAELGRIVEMLGIGALLDRRPGSLSGGEKQRVALGRAILSRPRMLLMDEPLAALDDARKVEILTYLERLRDETRLPILYVSHSVSEVARLATTLVLVEDGTVRRAGPASDILSDLEIAPALGLREAGALLSARVAAQDDDGLTRLDAAGGPLWIPRLDAAPGTALRLRILARDVMLSLEHPQGVSALNILRATVETIRHGDGPGALVRLKTGHGEVLLARVTQRSVRILGLQPGLPVHAVIKAVSVARGDIAEAL